ncbi:MAG: ABC transporter permease [Firmicutes bacterium]|nr:ABC transporter permease [Bacillota bacterium]
MKKATLSPYILWSSLFIIVPLLLVVYYSVTIETPEGIELSLENFKKFFEPIYLKVLWRSIILALISTVICLILGYPAALILAGKSFKRSNTLIMLFMLPMWMNFLLRTYAWLTLLEKNGLVNMIFQAIGLQPLNILYTETAVILGMVYNFLPFMVLPIYSVVSKIDRSIIEAAEDLGANSLIVFLRIILPLSIPGVVSGITMVFMPAVTTFVISRLLGGGQFMLIGNLIEQQFLFVGDWGFGSAISVVMILVILVSIGFMSRFENEEQGGRLW